MNIIILTGSAFNVTMITWFVNFVYFMLMDPRKTRSPSVEVTLVPNKVCSSNLTFQSSKFWLVPSARTLKPSGVSLTSVPLVWTELFCQLSVFSSLTNQLSVSAAFLRGGGQTWTALFWVLLYSGVEGKDLHGWQVDIRWHLKHFCRHFKSPRTRSSVGGNAGDGGSGDENPQIKPWRRHHGRVWIHDYLKSWFFFAVQTYGGGGRPELPLTGRNNHQFQQGLV